MFDLFFCPLCGLPDTACVTMRVTYVGSVYRLGVCENCADRQDIQEAVRMYIDLHPYMHAEYKYLKGVDVDV